jgi:glucosamine--fructose-6-phosphate aminotransferase (isomerizing)
VTPSLDDRASEDNRRNITSTLMYAEAAEAGESVARFMARNKGELARLAAHLAQCRLLSW